MMLEQRAQEAMKVLVEGFSDPSSLSRSHPFRQPLFNCAYHNFGGKRQKRGLAFVSVVGSLNYGCEVNNSDLDFKAAYFPTMGDMYLGKFPVMDVTTDSLDCSVSAVHHMKKYLLKGNLNFVETLFSRVYYVDEELLPFWEVMKRLVTMNVRELVLACFFTAERMHKKYMSNPPEKGKKASHAYRMLVFVRTLLQTGRMELAPHVDDRRVIKRYKQGNTEGFENAYEHLHSEVSSMIFINFKTGKNFEMTAAVNNLDKTDTVEWMVTNNVADEMLSELMFRRMGR